jgi:hypothetical protein
MPQGPGQGQVCQSCTNFLQFSNHFPVAGIAELEKFIEQGLQDPCIQGLQSSNSTKTV